MSALKRVVRGVDAAMEKQARWRLVAERLGTGKTKRECFDKYRELKEERNRRKMGDKITKEVPSKEVTEGEGLPEVDQCPVPQHQEPPEGEVAEPEAEEEAREAHPKPAAEAKPEVVEGTVEAPPLESNEAKPEVVEEAPQPEAAQEAPIAAEAEAEKEPSSEAQGDAHPEPDVEPDAKPDSNPEPEIKPVVGAGSEGGEAAEDESTAVAADAPADHPAPSAAPAPAQTENEVDDSFDVDYPPSTVKLTAEEGCALRTLIFNDPGSCFNPAWAKQGFFFTKEDDLGYGLIQLEGGPCGAVAAVQAYVLRHILYGSENPPLQEAPQSFKEPDKKAQKTAVATALARMIYACSISKTGSANDFGKITKSRPAIVCTCGDAPHIQKSKTFKHDGCTEKVLLTSCYNYDDVLTTVKDNISMFMKKDGPGVVCLAYSCILSRTVDLVKADMDTNFGVAPKMIGNHGYANQEFVNLFLTGMATSNLFDGIKVFSDETGAESGDQLVMGGIKEQGDVGFLTLFEAYKSLEVGENLKTPVCPIWVVCSESHYSTLFSIKAKDVKVDENERKVDIYYYDPLGEQDEEIKLTLDRDAEDIPEDGGDETDLTPPINKVVRTKWGKVGVDWNGAEEIL